MKKERYVEKVRDIDIFFIISPPLCILYAIGVGQGIKNIIILGVYLIFVELAIRGLGQKGDTNIEEHIVLTVLKVLGFFMIYVVLAGDRILSFLGFVILAGLLYFLLYLIVIRNRKIPPKPDRIATAPNYLFN